GDVAVVRVADVERERRPGDRLEERLGAAHLAERHVAERELPEDVAAEARPLARERDQLAVRARVGHHRAVDGGVVDDPPGALDHAGVYPAHPPALALVSVADARATAQRLGER